MSNMRTAKTISITMPPELLTKAQQFANREHRTMSELLREALRRYIDEPRSVNRETRRALMEYGQGKAREMGIMSEEDVDRLIHEYRKEKRAKQA